MLPFGVDNVRRASFLIYTTVYFSGDAWINVFFNWTAFWSVRSSLWRFNAELERLKGQEGHLKYVVDGFRGGIVHDTLHHLEGTTDVFVQVLKIASLVDTTL